MRLCSVPRALPKCLNRIWMLGEDEAGDGGLSPTPENDDVTLVAHQIAAERRNSWLDVMPVPNRKDIHKLYSPKSRHTEFPLADYRHLIRAASNTAKAVAALHNLGCVIGDINHGSVLVGADATVRLIDCDSLQITLGGQLYTSDFGLKLLRRQNSKI